MKVYQRYILLFLIFLTNISCNKRVRDNYKLPYKHFPDMWGYKTENTLLQNQEVKISSNAINNLQLLL